MKIAFVYLIANVASLLCVGGALYLATQGLEGWGWFLFVAVCLGSSVRSGSDK